MPSRFPSFKSAPLAVPPTAPAGIAFNAAGSSERQTSQTSPAPPPAPFPQYALSVPVGPIAPGANIGGLGASGATLDGLGERRSGEKYFLNQGYFCGGRDGSLMFTL